MELTILKNIGLTDGEIKIYEVLLEAGELPATEIILRSKIKKGDCYNKIYDLKARGFVEELTKDKKKHFRLAHPNAIKDYIDQKMKEMSTNEREIDALLPGIISTYNLSSHKPGVQFFEGEDAIRKITEDSLTAKTEILSYADIRSFLNSYSSLNQRYLKKRYALGIKKKFIVSESDFNHEYFTVNQKFTEIRYIKHPLEQFNLNAQIYDNKISFLSFKDNRIIGIIIEDKFIAKLQRELFSYIWDTASI